MTIPTISKLEAANRQLCTAICSFFADDEPVTSPYRLRSSAALPQRRRVFMDTMKGKNALGYKAALYLCSPSARIGEHIRFKQGSDRVDRSAPD